MLNDKHDNTQVLYTQEQYIQDLCYLYKPTEADWLMVKNLTLGTVGKHSDKAPTDAFKHNLLVARHSPIRDLRFVFSFTVPYWVSVHLVRHVHAQPYISSQRNDRQQDYDRRKAPQDAPVLMRWSMNAEELMTIANKRLCTKASRETRMAIKAICDMVEQDYPEFKGLLVPACVYNGGVCHEFTPCGRGMKYDEYMSLKDAMKKGEEDWK